MNNTIILTNVSAYIQIALYSKPKGLAFDCHSASVVAGGFVCGEEDLLLAHRRLRREKRRSRGQPLSNRPIVATLVGILGEAKYLKKGV